MRSALLILLLFASLYCGSTNYYVSSTGNDLNPGTSSISAWQTISKVNSTHLYAGDTVFFRRGHTFYGELILSYSGSSAKDIVYSAYSTGSDPIISGFTELSTWVLHSGSIYKSAVTCKVTVNMLTINGIPQRLGRYPNTGWLTYDSHSTSVSITDNQLTASPNWTGAELVVRKNHWIIDRGAISNHSGTTLTYSASAYAGTDGYGYFIQRSNSALDALGEWNYSAGYVYAYLPSPESYEVKVSTLDTLVLGSNKDYITFDNISFEGANLAAFFLTSCDHITIQNCQISNSGRDAIKSENLQYFTLTGSTITNTLNNSVDLDTYGGTGTNATITYNTISNSGTLVGMDRGYGDGCNFALSIQVPKSQIRYNTLDSCGYNGIIFVEDSTTVEYNYVSNFCLVKDDGSAIYTYQQTASPVYSGRVVKKNIILNGNSDATGTSDGTEQSNGIYMDGYTQNVSIDSNSVFSCDQAGLFLGWYTTNITVNGNYFVDNGKQLYLESKLASQTFTITNNVFACNEEGQRCVVFSNTTTESNPDSLGTWAGNFYLNPFNNVGMVDLAYTLNTKQFRTTHVWAGWTQDATGTPSPVSIQSWTDGYVGTNKFSNGSFNTGISGVGSSYSGTVVPTWNAADSSLLVDIQTHSVAASDCNIRLLVGSLEANKNYVVKISTKGATGTHTANVHLRNVAAPYAYLSEIQHIVIASTGWTDSELLFRTPTATTSAYLYIVVNDTTDDCYIDNVGVYEATVLSKDLDKYIYCYSSTVALSQALPTPSLGINGVPSLTATVPAWYTGLYYRLPGFISPRSIITGGGVYMYQGKIVMQ